MVRGLLYSIVIALSLLVAAAGGDEIIVETSHATIEAHEGKRLRVVFAAEDRPTLIFKPEAGAWDWSQTSQLVIPVENPGDEALTMSLHVEDHTTRSLTGKVAIAPRSAGSLAISVGAPPPRSMGMIAGPSPAGAGLDRGVWPVTATEGAIDASHVTLIRLGIPRPSAPRPLIVGMPRVEPDRTSYVGIVDTFGQFFPGEWPEKVSSAEMLRAKGGEEARVVAQWLADSPRRVLETLDLLQEKLAEYRGTVLLVSHDRDFLDRVVTSTIATDGNGRWVEYAGGYTDMLAQRAAESRGAPPPKTRNTKRSRPATQTSELSGGLPRRMNFSDRRALDLLPARIAALEARITELNAVLADLDLYRRDPARFRDTTDALAVTRDELAAAEDHWLRLEMLREDIEGIEPKA